MDTERVGEFVVGAKFVVKVRVASDFEEDANERLGVMFFDAAFDFDTSDHFGACAVWSIAKFEEGYFFFILGSPSYFGHRV
jgi:hypothetical protein